MENYLNKWIVYCTVNLKNKKIYIGVHKTSNPYIFDGYIGCGVWVKRPSSYEKSDTAFRAAVKKYGPKSFIRITIGEFDNEEEAYNIEAQIVTKEFIASNNNYNMVLGGGSETTTNIATHQYSKTGEYIMSFDSQTDAAKYHNVNHKTINRAISERTRVKDFYFSSLKVDKLDIEERPKNYIYQYNDKGEYIRAYESMTEAAIENGTNVQNLSKKIIEGISYKGFYYSKIKSDKFDTAKSSQIISAKVYQYSEDGDFIAEYENQSKAIKALGKSRGSIYRAIKLGGLFANSQWRFEKFDKIDKFKRTKNRKVAKLDLDDNLIKVYGSKKEAELENGRGLAHVLNGRDKTHKGYIYKYLD